MIRTLIYFSILNTIAFTSFSQEIDQSSSSSAIDSMYRAHTKEILEKTKDKISEVNFSIDTYLIFSVNDNYLLIYKKGNNFYLRIYEKSFNYKSQKTEFMERYSEDEINKCNDLLNVFNKDICKTVIVDDSEYAHFDSRFIFFIKVIDYQVKCEYITPILYSSKTTRQVMEKKFMKQQYFNYLFSTLYQHLNRYWMIYTNNTTANKRYNQLPHNWSFMHYKNYYLSVN